MLYLPPLARAAAFSVAAFAMLAAGLKNPATAQTMCTEPLRPLCLEMAAGTIDWASPEGQRCRQDLERYEETLDDYRQCLGQKLQEIQAETERLENLLRCTAESPQDCEPEAARAIE